MKTIDASTVEKFEPDVGVTGTESMTEELQADFAKNSAFQGYMWVPCLCQSAKQSGTGVGYQWSEFLVPNAEIEICVMLHGDITFNEYARFRLYSGDVLLNSPHTDTQHDDFSEDAAYIATLPKGQTFVRLEIWPLYTTPDLEAFTVFYRIVR